MDWCNHQVRMMEKDQHGHASCPICRARRERDAYREAGARLLQAAEKRYCFAQNTWENLLLAMDRASEVILKESHNDQ